MIKYYEAIGDNGIMEYMEYYGLWWDGEGEDEGREIREKMYGVRYVW